jgi:hypothetical protein
MNQHILATNFLNYISHIQIDQSLNDWTCKGKTDITYGSPNGGWDGMNGFLFVKKDNSYSYVIRSIPKEDTNSYIVIESLNLKGQLYNMDLANPRICKENQGKTYLLESYRMTVGKGKKREIDVENSFKSFGINTNEVSVIEDLKPDWQKTLTDILGWAILREKVKLDLKNGTKLIDVRFDQIIKDFRAYIRVEKTKIKDFTFQKIYPQYVWISDSENKIGKDGFCHYELITRKKHPNKIFVEIHFDEKRKKQFKKLISDHKNEKTFWNNEHQGGELSLAYFESYDFEDEDLFLKLEEALFYLESNFGELIRNEFKSLSKFLQSNQSMTNHSLNQILYGPPGTGKTYNTINKAIEIANPDFNLIQKRDLIKVEYGHLVESGQIVFTTFHQSMSYEDFIEGIKPETKNGIVFYDVVPGLFLEICKTAENNWEDAKEGNSKKLSFEDAFSQLKEEWIENEEIKFPLKREGNDFTITGFTTKSIQFRKASGGTGHTLSIATLKDFYYKKKEIRMTGVGIYYPSIIDKLNKYHPIITSEKTLKNYVIIIDEINRGNVSQIFGELITLIEENKRLGNEEALEVMLPYSKEKFGVPPNLFIIGTMNTADRSVEALDAALRRRFCFEEMPPLYDLEGLQNEFFGYAASEILEKINLRIEKMLDKDHKIGHSYLLNKDQNSIIDSFYKNIIPLLQEYFFGDYSKIGLVLGKGFVHLKESEGSDIFAKFYDVEDDFDNRNVYEIIDYRKDKLDQEINFGQAIQVLMNK